MAGRPRKARTEGEALEAVVAGTRKPRTRAEASKAENVREDREVYVYHAEALKAAVEAFKVAYPDKWEAIRLCPTWHGFDEMTACLNS